MIRTLIDRGWHTTALFIALIVLIAMMGCSRKAVVAGSDTITTTVIETCWRDTIIRIQDSAGIRALLECDSLGRIRVKQMAQYLQGLYVKPRIEIKNNYIQADCVIDSAAVATKYRQDRITRSKTINTVIVRSVNYLTSWQWFQVWSGRIALILLAVYFGWKILNSYFKFTL